MKIIVYGIKACGSVKKAFSYLESRGLTYEFVDFKTTPPDSARLKRWADALGIKSLFNTKGTTYRKLGLSQQNLDDGAKLESMLAHPMLIKRPVIEIVDSADSSVRYLVGFDEVRYSEAFGK